MSDTALQLRPDLRHEPMRIAGRKEVVGKPFLYGTTREFLQHFGLRTLKELPPLEQFDELFGGDADGSPVAAGPDSEEEIELCQMPPGTAPVEVQPDLMHLAFSVDDLEGFAAGLKEKGYALSDGPTRLSSGGVIAFIDAPEGYEVELIQRARS